MLVSFDVQLVFTKITTDEAMEEIRRITDNEIAVLIELC